MTARRRSLIIDGFEDIEIYLTTIIPREEWETRDIEVSRELARWSINENRSKVTFAAYVEIYVSKYNTADQSYWVKPTEEQEYRYRDALRSAFREAVRETCEGIQLSWAQIDSDRSRCGSTLNVLQIPAPESDQRRE